MKIIFLIIPVIELMLIAFGQDSILARAMESKVLSENEIGKNFSFNVSKHKEERNMVEIKYLGYLETSAHVIYKALTWKRIWGPNFHTTGVVEFFDKDNRYIGKYILGDGSDLPDRIANNNLFFSNKNKEDCDTQLITSIDFRNGIPKEIFLQCKDGSGDIYSFSTKE